MREIKTVTAEDFIQGNQYPESSVYIFPFDVLDKTLGGQNLGKIEWQIEPIKGRKTKGRYYIEKLLVMARQTRDERYADKLFEIPCYTEMIAAHSTQKGDNYLDNLWIVSFCEVHKALVFRAYPQNHHRVLKINVGSSVMTDITFE